ncbi:MAG: hypothetical protein QW273_01420 [Candidatus Pacearchaeota archaeon]
MEQDKLLVYVAIFAVVLSLLGTIVSYNSIMSMRKFFTGFATENGTVTVEVSVQTLIKIYRAGGVDDSTTINWGQGSVEGGKDYALLVSNGTVYQGSWSVIPEGFFVRNIGNTNVSLKISSLYDVNTFLGGTDPQFKYNVSNLEAGSCTFVSGYENVYKDFSTTPEQFCDVFQFADDKDEIRVDVLLKVPSDSLTGIRNNTVILTYEAV